MSIFQSSESSIAMRIACREEESSSLTAPGQQEALDTTDVILKIEFPAFNPKNVWIVSNGSVMIYVTISDPHFIVR